MHLHGHDFAILAQLNGTEFNKSRGAPDLKLSNPPRRDTALLDSDGYLLIAFKPVRVYEGGNAGESIILTACVQDNPGIWLFHCHIVSLLLHVQWRG